MRYQILFSGSYLVYVIHFLLHRFRSSVYFMEMVVMLAWNLFLFNTGVYPCGSKLTTSMEYRLAQNSLLDVVHSWLNIVTWIVPCY